MDAGATTPAASQLQRPHTSPAHPSAGRRSSLFDSWSNLQSSITRSQQPCPKVILPSAGPRSSHAMLHSQQLSSSSPPAGHPRPAASSQGLCSHHGLRPATSPPSIRQPHNPSTSAPTPHTLLSPPLKLPPSRHAPCRLTPSPSSSLASSAAPHSAHPTVTAAQPQPASTGTDMHPSNLAPHGCDDPTSSSRVAGYRPHTADPLQTAAATTGGQASLRTSKSASHLLPGRWHEEATGERCSTGVQAAPVPWTRYFFPEDLTSHSPRPGAPYYQYFDVRAAPAEPTSQAPQRALPPAPPGPVPELHAHAPPPPAWAVDAYLKLAQVSIDDAAGGAPASTARDAVQGGAALVTAGGLAAHWQQVRDWALAVACLRPRSWSDAEALARLQGAVIAYLVQQLAAAPDAPGAEFKLECQRWVERRAREVEEAGQQQVQAEVAALRAQAAATLGRLKAQAGHEAEEELGALLDRGHREGAKLQQQLVRAQAAFDKTQSDMASSKTCIETLNSKVGRLEEQLQEQEQAAAAQAGQLSTQITTLRHCLTGATSAILEAVKQQDLEGVWALAMAAVCHLTSAAYAYCGKFEVPEGEAALRPRGSMVSERQGGGSRMSHSSRVSRASSAFSSMDGGGGAELPLVLHYVAASAGMEFVVGQELTKNQGISWRLLDTACHGVVDVPDVADEASIKWLRPGADPEQMRGSFYAAAVFDNQGTIVGMVAADTCKQGGPGKRLMDEDKSTIKLVADAVQECFNTQYRLMIQSLNQGTAGLEALEDDEEGEERMEVVYAAEEEADILGGRALMRQAYSELAGVSRNDVEMLVELPDCGATAWAVIKGAAGVLVPDAPSYDWSVLRIMLADRLLQRLMELEMDEIDWEKLQAAAKEALAMPAFTVAVEGRAVRALHCWLVAAKKLVAHSFVITTLQAKLDAVNRVVITGFSNSKGGMVRELAALRERPVGTAVMLRAILQVLGYSPAVVHGSWNKCRHQVGPDLANRMVSVRPNFLTKSAQDSLEAALDKVPAGLVYGECSAGVLLHAWALAVFSFLCSTTHPMNRKAAPPPDRALSHLHSVLNVEC